jgi:hypothetical protein
VRREIVVFEVAVGNLRSSSALVHAEPRGQAAKSVDA